MLEAAALLDTAVALFKRFRWLLPAVPFMALSAFLALKLYGFLWWDGALDTVAKQAVTIAQIEHASKANEQAQREQVAKLEAKYDAIAKDSAHDLQIAQSDARSALDRYVAANRLHKDSLCRRAPDPASQGKDPGVPPEMPADPDMVAVPVTDLQAVADWIALGVTLRNREVSKVEAGLAEMVADDGLPGPKPGF